MECPSETLQNLPYFWNTKIHVCKFLFFISCYFIFPLMNTLVYVDNGHRPGHLLGEKIKGNEMKKKTYAGFRIPKIWQILKCFTRSFNQA